jgi:CrcB protein
MPLALWVGIGGAAGSVCRYLLSVAVQQRATSSFPVGTLLINITGSLILGFLLRYATGSSAMSPETRALLTTGFCGGYTTFSTFSYESVALIEDGDWRRATAYIALSVVLSVAACLGGVALARSVLVARSGG